MSAIVVASGPLAGLRVEVDRELTLGRIDADVVLDDDEVSRRHAILRPAADGIEIEDAGSTNGTWVNGERVFAATRLRPGDQVRVGGVTFDVERVADPLATRISSPAAAETTASSAVPAATGEREETPAWAEPAVAEASDPQHAAAPPVGGAPARTPSSLAALAGARNVLVEPPAFAASATRRHGPATRLLAPTAVSLVAVAGTSVALIVYFAAR